MVDENISKEFWLKHIDEISWWNIDEINSLKK